MKNKKGFTVIELLAVIVILGIVIAIAIPATSGIINNSRRKSFISTARLFINNVRTKATAGEFNFPPDSESLIIISWNMIDLEKGGKESPYGAEWDYHESYVIIQQNVMDDVTPYIYSVAAKDKLGNSIPITLEEDLNVDSITMNATIPKLVDFDINDTSRFVTYALPHGFVQDLRDDFKTAFPTIVRSKNYMKNPIVIAISLGCYEVTGKMSTGYHVVRHKCYKGNSNFQSEYDFINLSFSTVKSIGANAFKGTEVEWARISNTTVSIGDGAFADTGIQKVYIMGDCSRFDSRWEQIGFGSAEKVCG